MIVYVEVIVVFGIIYEYFVDFIDICFIFNSIVGINEFIKFYIDGFSFWVVFMG